MEEGEDESGEGEEQGESGDEQEDGDENEGSSGSDDDDDEDDEAQRNGKAAARRRSKSLEPPPRPSKQHKRWGKRPHPFSTQTPPVPIKHFPALLDGSVALALVLERRPAEPPYAPDLNKWQHRMCAQCGHGQTTGFGFFTSDVRAVYCHYTELLYCRGCMAAEPRPIPWRLLHELDDTPRPVSKPAAAFIDPVLGAPIVNLPALAPRTLAGSKGLSSVQAQRARLQAAVQALGAAAAALGGDADATAQDARRIAAASLAKLAWLLDSGDLVPLSLIVPLHKDPGPAIKRTRAALAALQQFAEQRGLEGVEI